MRVKRSKIILDSLQIKSLEKARRLAAALTVIEEECGIHEVKIEINGYFLCEWVDLEKLNQTPMEKLLRDILK